MSKYNGWTNRETWAVALWFNPETKQDLIGIKEHVEEELAKLPGWLQDLVYDQINWDEIESALDDNSEEGE